MTTYGGIGVELSGSSTLMLPLAIQKSSVHERSDCAIGARDDVAVGGGQPGKE